MVPVQSLLAPGLRGVQFGTLGSHVSHAQQAQIVGLSADHTAVQLLAQHFGDIAHLQLKQNGQHGPVAQGGVVDTYQPFVLVLAGTAYQATAGRYLSLMLDILGVFIGMRGQIGQQSVESLHATVVEIGLGRSYLGVTGRRTFALLVLHGDARVAVLDAQFVGGQRYGQRAECAADLFLQGFVGFSLGQRSLPDIRLDIDVGRVLDKWPDGLKRHDGIHLHRLAQLLYVCNQ